MPTHRLTPPQPRMEASAPQISTRRLPSSEPGYQLPSRRACFDHSRDLHRAPHGRLALPPPPHNAVGVDGIINTYVKSSASRWKSQSSEMCALDAEVWGLTLHMYAWYLNSYSSQSFVINFFPMRPNGAHFGSVIHGDIMTLSAEELTISANWQWTAQNIPPHVFGIMLGGGQNAITNRYLGNLTMRGLSPCSDYFMKMVYAISEMPYRATPSSGSTNRSRTSPRCSTPSSGERRQVC